MAPCPLPSPSRRGFICLALATALLSGDLLAGDLVVNRVFGPEVKTGDYKHPASFDQLQNGDLYLAFFSGQGEYNDNAAAVFGARLEKGGSQWSPPTPIARDPFHSLGN